MFLSGDTAISPPLHYLQVLLEKALLFLYCVSFFLFVLQMPNDLLKEIFLRNTAGKANPEHLIYLDEGLTTTVAVFRW